MSEIKTVTIIHPKDPAATMKINEEDFDPKLHKLAGAVAGAAPGPKGGTTTPPAGGDKGAGAQAQGSADALVGLDVADDVKDALVKTGFADLKAIAKMTDKAFDGMVKVAGLTDDQAEALFDAVTKLKD
jgi:hypothetical protein